MTTLKLAFRKLFRKGEYTTARIISLSVGLAFGIILLGEVLYYYSFDGFYPDADNIYVVHENYKSDKAKKDIQSHNRVSGAIGPGLQAEVPGVKIATRFNRFASTDFFTKDKKKYYGDFSFADENWSAVLPRPMISGDPKEILSQPMHCMISEELADKMGGNVIGSVINLKTYPDKPLTISGIFETLPENTLYSYDVLVSMVSTDQFTWDGTQNWLGNDRYYTCVKLEDGVTPRSLTPAIRKMQEKHQDIEEIEMKNPGFVLTYTFVPNKKIFPNRYKNIILILSIIAFSVLFVSLMNYILLTISSLVNQTKNSAIHKCYGAQVSNLRWMILVETIMVFVIALIGAGIIVYLAKPFVEHQVAHKISSMFSWIVVLPLSVLLLLILALIGYFPGRFFTRIPVATAFRSYRQKSNKWKLGLLFIQFIGASFILTVLMVVNTQYNKMQNANHGYQTEQVYFASTLGIDSTKIATVLNELRILPEVELVGFGNEIPITYPSGNNVKSPDGERELFNIADFYYVDENYMKILGISITEGENFSPERAITKDILISQSGADKLRTYNQWDDGVVGKDLTITEHHSTNESSTIRGVFPDFVINSMTSRDNRPAVFFFMPESKYVNFIKRNSSFGSLILIRTKARKHSDIIKKLTNVVNIGMPFEDAKIKSLEEEKRKSYLAERGSRNTMLIGSAIILLITLIGLLGYALSEVNRRRKSLAIRKINGATINDVLRLFLWDLQRIAIPAVVVGIVGAWFVAERWMQNFSEKVELHWFLFLLCSLGVLLFVGIIAIASYWKSSNSNPIESLRYE